MDEWGRDPSVKAMRRVFKAMEKSLDDLLEQLAISPFDDRIRGWLEQALIQYQLVWGEASRLGAPMDEKMASAVYAHCLVKIVGSEGAKIPENLFPLEKDVAKLMSEVFK